MNRLSLKTGLGIGAALLLLPLAGHAFNSGSTGADGAFNPQVNTELQLLPQGVFNFTSVNIPPGVTVTFKRNATNTPVTILVAENAVIAGTIDVAGETGPASGLPGKGGLGGFDGGAGGLPTGTGRGGNGMGPGGGGGADPAYFTQYGYTSYMYPGGGGAGYATAGQAGSQQGRDVPAGSGGSTYGSAVLLPLIGGSGGGGGAMGASVQGGGGSGGGAGQSRYGVAGIGAPNKRRNR
jgi:hypothetical protein